jgi:hypothetical protein
VLPFTLACATAEPELIKEHYETKQKLLQSCFAIRGYYSHAGETNGPHPQVIVTVALHVDHCCYAGACDSG